MARHALLAKRSVEPAAVRGGPVERVRQLHPVALRAKPDRMARGTGLHIAHAVRSSPFRAVRHAPRRVLPSPIVVARVPTVAKPATVQVGRPGLMAAQAVFHVWRALNPAVQPMPRPTVAARARRVADKVRVSDRQPAAHDGLRAHGPVTLKTRLGTRERARGRASTNSRRHASRVAQAVGEQSADPRTRVTPPARDRGVSRSLDRRREHPVTTGAPEVTVHGETERDDHNGEGDERRPQRRRSQAQPPTKDSRGLRPASRHGPAPSKSARDVRSPGDTASTRFASARDLARRPARAYAKAPSRPASIEYGHSLTARP